MTLDPNFTNFWENNDTSYSSGSVLIRNLIVSTEFVFCGKILSEMALCVMVKNQSCSDIASSYGGQKIYITLIMLQHPENLNISKLS